MMTFVLGHIVVSEPVSFDGDECPDCGFDAVLVFPLHTVSEAGVSEFGTYRGCVRCWEENADAGAS